jgi:hypothetical protein
MARVSVAGLLLLLPLAPFSGLGCGGGHAMPPANGGAAGGLDAGAGGAAGAIDAGAGGAGGAIDAPADRAAGGAGGGLDAGSGGAGGAVDAGSGGASGADGGVDGALDPADFRIRVGSQLPGGLMYRVWVDYRDPELVRLPLDLTLSDPNAGTMMISTPQASTILGDYGDWFQDISPLGYFTVCRPGMDAGCPATVTVDLRRGPKGAPIVSKQITILPVDTDPFTMATCNEIGNVVQYSAGAGNAVDNMGMWTALFYKQFNQAYDQLSFMIGHPFPSDSFQLDSAPDLTVGAQVQARLGGDLQVSSTSGLCSGSFVVSDLETDPPGGTAAMNVPIVRARAAWSLACNDTGTPYTARGCIDYDNSRPNPSGYVTITF